MYASGMIDKDDIHYVVVWFLMWMCGVYGFVTGC